MEELQGMRPLSVSDGGASFVTTEIAAVAVTGPQSISGYNSLTLPESRTQHRSNFSHHRTRMGCPGQDRQHGIEAVVSTLLKSLRYKLVALIHEIPGG